MPALAGRPCSFKPGYSTNWSHPSPPGTVARVVTGACEHNPRPNLQGDHSQPARLDSRQAGFAMTIIPAAGRRWQAGWIPQLHHAPFARSSPFFVILAAVTGAPSPVVTGGEPGALNGSFRSGGRIRCRHSALDACDAWRHQEN